MWEEGFARPQNATGEPFRVAPALPAKPRRAAHVSSYRAPRLQKPSYAGCGRHIDQVLGDVPPAERCRCREAKGSESAALASRTSSAAPGV